MLPQARYALSHHGGRAAVQQLQEARSLLARSSSLLRKVCTAVANGGAKDLVDEGAAAAAQVGACADEESVPDKEKRL